MRTGYRRTYILPTRRGLVFLLVIALGLIGAINYQLSLGFFLTFLLFGLFIVALLHTWASLPGLQFEVGAANPVFCGEHACFYLQLRNPTSRPRHDIRITIKHSSCWQGEVAGQASVRIPLAVQTTHRGNFHLPNLRVDSSAPLGWFRAWQTLAIPAQCLVYPAPESTPPPLPDLRDVGIGVMDTLQGDDDFAGLREYHTSDSPRHIAWKQLARQQQLLSKQWHTPLSGQIMLDWHDLPELDAEARLSRLAAWVLMAQARELRYGLILPAQRWEADNGPAHQARCLAALALYGSDQAGWLR